MHTRHSGDVEVDSPPRFLSLEDKRSRKSRPLVSDVDVSMESKFFFLGMRSRRWRLMADCEACRSTGDYIVKAERYERFFCQRLHC